MDKRLENKLEKTLELIEELRDIISNKDEFKVKCEQIAKENEDILILTSVDNAFRKFDIMAQTFSISDFEDKDRAKKIKGLLMNCREFIIRKWYINTDFLNYLEKLDDDLYLIYELFNSDEYMSNSDLDITFKYNGSKWTYGELLYIEEEFEITNYSDIEIIDNNTILNDSNIYDSIKKHDLQSIENAADALDNANIRRYNEDDIKEFLAEYDCVTIANIADDLLIYKNRDEFNEYVVDELLLSDLPDFVKRYFDYNAYWNGEARYSYTEMSNGTIFYTNF